MAQKRATVLRAARFAEGVDHLAAILGEDFKRRLLAGEFRRVLCEADVITLGRMPAEILRGLTHEELSRLARLQRSEKTSLATAKRAYRRLNESQRNDFVIWLAARLEEVKDHATA